MPVHLAGAWSGSWSRRALAAARLRRPHKAGDLTRRAGRWTKSQARSPAIATTSANAARRDAGTNAVARPGYPYRGLLTGRHCHLLAPRCCVGSTPVGAAGCAGRPAPDPGQLKTRLHLMSRSWPTRYQRPFLRKVRLSRATIENCTTRPESMATIPRTSSEPRSPKRPPPTMATGARWSRPVPATRPGLQINSGDLPAGWRRPPYVSLGSARQATGGVGVAAAIFPRWAPTPSIPPTRAECRGHAARFVALEHPGERLNVAVRNSPHAGPDLPQDVAIESG